MIRPAVFSVRRGGPRGLRIAGASLAAGLCALLSACGGGLVAGVGSGGSGVAEGTLSGFGSVIVDGVEYSESALAVADRSALKLGQRVRLVFGSNDVARSVEVLAQLRGPVTAALDDSGWLRIGGQWARVVKDNDDFSRSGITLLDGFGGDAIAADQDAVAYGSWAWDNSKSAYVLVATRVEKLAVPADPVLLGGVALAVQGGGFRLNAGSGTQVTASRVPSLTDGTLVALQVARSALVASGGAVAAVQAQEVQDASLGALDLSPYQTVRLGGLTTGFNGDGGTVTIQGTRLRIGPIAGSLGNGQFARATADNGLTASTLQPRTGSPVGMRGDDGTGAVTQLKGVLAGVDWSSASVTFVLRGITVQANAAQITQSCRSSGSTQALYVQVDGYAPSPSAPLRANTVTCSTDLSAAQDL